MAGTKVNQSVPDTTPPARRDDAHMNPSGPTGREANWQDLESLHKELKLLGWTVELERWSDGGFINVSRSGASVGLVTWSETQGTITISPSNNKFPDRNFPFLRTDMMEQINSVWPEGTLYSNSGTATIYVNCAYPSPDFVVVE